MLRLEINQTYGQIGIQRTPGSFQMESPKQTLDISTTQAQVRVEGTLPKVQIDQSQCFSECGLKGISDFMADAVSYATGKMLESMGRIAEQGTAMTDIHQNTSAIADQALYNAYDQFINEFNYDAIPKSRPTITVIEGQLDIQVTEGTVTNNTQVQKPSLSYQQGKVEVYLAQRNSIEIHAVDAKV